MVSSMPEEKRVALWPTLWKWRRFIVYNFLIVTAVSALVSVLLPSWYQAASTVLPQSQETGQLSLRLRELGLGPLMASPTAESSEILVAVLRSRTVAKAVARKFSLVQTYRVGDIEEAADLLMERTDFNLNLDGTVSVRVLAKDPELAARLANGFVQELDEFRQKNTMTKGRLARRFLEGRLKEARVQLEEAEVSLEKYQEETSMPVLSQEMETAARAAGELAAEYQVLLVELGMARQLWAEDSEPVRRLKLKLDEIRKQLESIPEVGMGLVRLLREVRVQEELYSYLQARYEEAKIQEVRDTPTIQILDEAYPPRYRAKPKRKLLVGTAALLSLIAGALLSILLEKHSNLRPYGVERKGQVA